MGSCLDDKHICGYMVVLDECLGAQNWFSSNLCHTTKGIYVASVSPPLVCRKAFVLNSCICRSIYDHDHQSPRPTVPILIWRMEMWWWSCSSLYDRYIYLPRPTVPIGRYVMLHAWFTDPKNGHILYTVENAVFTSLRSAGKWYGWMVHAWIYVFGM